VRQGLWLSTLRWRFCVAGGRIGTLKFDWSNADGYLVGGESRV